MRDILKELEAQRNAMKQEAGLDILQVLEKQKKAKESPVRTPETDPILKRIEERTPDPVNDITEGQPLPGAPESAQEQSTGNVFTDVRNALRAGREAQKPPPKPDPISEMFDETPPAPKVEKQPIPGAEGALSRGLKSSTKLIGNVGLAARRAEAVLTKETPAGIVATAGMLLDPLSDEYKSMANYHVARDLLKSGTPKDIISNPAYIDTLIGDYEAQIESLRGDMINRPANPFAPSNKPGEGSLMEDLVRKRDALQRIQSRMKEGEEFEDIVGEGERLFKQPETRKSTTGQMINYGMHVRDKVQAEFPTTGNWKDDFWIEVGQAVGQTPLLIGAIVTAPYSGGASLALKGLYMTSLVGMVGSEAGLDYEEYFREQDRTPSYKEKASMMLVNAGLESAAESVRMGRIFKYLDPLAKKALKAPIFKTLAKNEKVLNNIYDKHIKHASEAQRRAFTKGAVAFGKNVIEEGGEEWATEGAQSMVPMLYKDKEHWPTIEEIWQSSLAGMRGGMYMGGFISGAQTWSQSKMLDMQRKDRGALIFGRDTTSGKDVEITGQTKEGDYIVMYDNGDIATLPDKSIDEIAQVPYDIYRDMVATVPKTDEQYEHYNQLIEDENQRISTEGREEIRSKEAARIKIKSAEADREIETAFAQMPNILLAIKKIQEHEGGEIEKLQMLDNLVVNSKLSGEEAAIAMKYLVWTEANQNMEQEMAEAEAARQRPRSFEPDPATAQMITSGFINQSTREIHPLLDKDGNPVFYVVQGNPNAPAGDDNRLWVRPADDHTAQPQPYMPSQNTLNPGKPVNPKAYYEALMQQQQMEFGQQQATEDIQQVENEAIEQEIRQQAAQITPGSKIEYQGQQYTVLQVLKASGMVVVPEGKSTDEAINIPPEKIGDIALVEISQEQAGEAEIKQAIDQGIKAEKEAEELLKPQEDVTETEIEAGNAIQPEDGAAPEPGDQAGVPEGIGQDSGDGAEGTPAVLGSDQEAIKKAEAEVDPNPSEAQIEAGNAKKGHVRINGLDITIENAKGSTRRGTAPDGTTWENTINHPYGYIRRTEGKDGDQIDVFLGDNMNADQVFVIDQVDPKTGQFDEHKVMMGFESEQEARDAYLSNYEEGWQGLGNITPMGIDAFKEWAGDGTRTQQPAAKEQQQEPWEMTPDEYVEYISNQSSNNDKVAVRSIALSGHPQHVKKAIAEGKHVPDNVLQKYKHNYWAQAEIDKRRPAAPKEPEKAPRQEPVQNKIKGIETEREFAGGVKAKGNLTVIEADQLQPSHKAMKRNPLHGIPEAQPKERTDKASDAASTKIASNPEWEKLGNKTLGAYHGAPTVNSRGEVIQGNNRSEALLKYWDMFPDDDKGLRQFLIDNAEEFGLDPEQIAGMENPVLVNMVDVDDQTAIKLGQYTAQDLETGGNRRITPKETLRKLEQAKQARFSEIITEGADPNDTIKAIIRTNAIDGLKYLLAQKAITETQYQSAFKDGQITKDAIEDLTELLKYNLFQGAQANFDELFDRLPYRAQNALITTAHINSNEQKDSLRPFVQEAIALLQAYNADSGDGSKQDIQGWWRTADMWKGNAPSQRYSPLSLTIATLLKDAKTEKEITGKIREYYTLVNGTQDMFPIPAISMQEALKKIFNFTVNIQDDVKRLAHTTDSGQDAAGRPGEDAEPGEQGVRPDDQRGDSGQDKPAPEPDPGRNQQPSDQGEGKIPQKRLTTEVEKREHTKTGEDIFVTALQGRQDKDVFARLKSIAKSNDGYYSVYAKGFVFKNTDAAEKFRDEVDRMLQPQQPEQPQQPQEQFTPKDGWEDNLIKAREYANALGIKHTGLKLDEIVRQINRHRRKHIGQNASGGHIYEDHNGVRIVVERGIERSQAVSVIPGRGSTYASPEQLFRDGNFDFLTPDEVRNYNKKEIQEEKQPQQQPENKHAKQQEKSFNDLLLAIPGLKDIKVGFYQKSGEKGDAIMPFSVEAQHLDVGHNIHPGLPGFRLVMEHNYIQEGDLMTDPRIDVAVYPKQGLVVPLNYEVNGMGVYNEYVSGGKVVDEKGMLDTHKFLSTWMQNLKDQGRVIGEQKKDDSPKPPEIIPPKYTDGKLVKKVNTPIGIEYHVKYKSSGGSYTAVFRTSNPNLQYPAEFQTENALDAYKSKLFNEPDTDSPQPNPKPPTAPKPADNYGADNKLVSKDRYEELKKRMKGKLGNLNVGFDPEMMAIGTEMAMYHVEAGARKFKAFAKAMIGDLGEAISPYLKAFYKGARMMPGMEGYAKEMDGDAFVDSFDIAKETKESGNPEEVDKFWQEVERDFVKQTWGNRKYTIEDVARRNDKQNAVLDIVERLHHYVTQKMMDGVMSGTLPGNVYNGIDTTKTGYIKQLAEKLYDRIVNSEKNTNFDSEQNPQDNEQGSKDTETPTRPGSKDEADLDEGEQPTHPDGTMGGRDTSDEGSGQDSTGRKDTSEDDRAGDEQDGGRGDIPSHSGSGRRDSGQDADKGKRIPEDRGRGNELDPSEKNHIIAPDDVIVPSGDMARVDANIRAIKLAKKLQKENRNATPQEKKVLAQYVGWGGLAPIFENKTWDSNWKNKWGDRATELRSILEPKELSAAKNSTINAHYTDRGVIETLWSIAEKAGFKGGKVLEPAGGIGHFFGLMPTGLHDTTSLIGYELDEISGLIFQKLYPQAKIKVAGYETATNAANSIDLAISNVPFGAVKVYDKANKDITDFNIHNYFIAKSARLLKPGGMGIFITTAATMDNMSEGKQFRQWMTSTEGGNSDLVAAIRLPNDAFKKNAGTEVTTDILVFRKRTDDGPSVHAKEIINVIPISEAKTREGKTVQIQVNEYFASNPSQMIGKMMLAHEAGSGGLYSGDSQTLAPEKGVDLQQRLNELVSQMPENIADTKSQEEDAPQETEHKEGSLHVIDGKPKIVWGGYLVTPEWNDNKVMGKYTKVTVLKDYLNLKDSIKRLIELETTEGASETEIGQQRKALNNIYDAFVRKYGEINENRKISFLNDDVESSLVNMLEVVERKYVKGENGKEVCIVSIYKSDIFTKRVNHPRTEPKTANNISDAMNISMSYRNKVDIDYIAEMLNLSQSEVKSLIISEGLGFINPANGLLIDKATYLSGNVRQKLAQARQAAETNKAFDRNVSELEAVMPKDIPYFQIDIQLGAPWMPPKVISEFVKKTLGVEAEYRYNKKLSEWVVIRERYGYNSKNNAEFAGGGTSGTKLVELALNGKVPNITYKDKATGSIVKDQEKTAEAIAAQTNLRMMFKEFAGMLTEATARELEQIYNEKYNNYVEKKWEAPTYKHYPGASKDLELRTHQKIGVSRAINHSTLLAHQVGTGKTFTLVTAAMEMRRLGIAKKPMIVVQKATLNQFIASYRQLYPTAKILAPQDKDLTAKDRHDFFAKVAMNDWDTVIIHHDALNRIPDDPTRVTNYLFERISELEQAILETGSDDGHSKQRMEKEIEELEKKIEDTINKGRKAKEDAKQAINAKARILKQLDRKTDDVIFFEQLGVDALLIDEAHTYKKLGFATKGGNIKGIDRSGSQKSISAMLKVKFIQEKNQGKNVVFATGTPVSNTMAEIWTMMKFLTPDKLAEYGVTNFDEFKATFGEVKPSIEFTAAGEFKSVDRFASYVNVPELKKLFRISADIVLTEEIESLKAGTGTPNLKDGKITNVELDMSPELQSMMAGFKRTLKAWEKLSGKEKKALMHIPLVIFGLAKRAAIDIRLVNSSLPESKGSKLMAVAENVGKLYQESSGHKGAQLIFCDARGSKDGKFVLADELKAQLIKNGIKEEEIASIYDHDTDAKREKLFTRVNQGEVRVLIGSTEKLGIGVNVQERLYAIHHMDAPQRPMDFEQRNGRILRQGNMHLDLGMPVHVVTYGVKKSLDATAYQRLAIKHKFIQQMLSKDMTQRTVDDDDDVSGMSYNQMMATLSGSQYAIIHTKKMYDLQSLEIEERLFANRQVDVKHRADTYERLIPVWETKLQKIEQAAEEVIKSKISEGITKIRIGQTDHIVTKDNSASDIIASFIKPAIEQLVNTQSYDSKKKANVIINDHLLLEIHAEISLSPKGIAAWVGYQSIHTDDLAHIYLTDSITGKGVATSIKSYFDQDNVQSKLDAVKHSITEGKNTIENAKTFLREKFPKQAKLDALRAEIKELERLMEEETKITDATIDDSGSIDDIDVFRNENASDNVSEPDIVYNERLKKLPKDSVYEQMRFEFEGDAISMSDKRLAELPGQEDIKKKMGYSTQSKGKIYLERQLRADKTFNLLGNPLTGAAKIHSSDDVAYLFRALQDQAVENFFVVLHKDDGTYKVLYHSTGSTWAAQVDVKTIYAAAKEFGAIAITGVHNHPSGSLKYSEADVEVHRKLDDAFRTSGILVNSSVIINLHSGYYAIYTSSDILKQKVAPAPDQEIQPEVLRFDRQVLYDYDPLTQPGIFSSRDAAEYLSKQKVGTLPKTHLIVVNRSNQITRYVMLDEKLTFDQLKDNIIYEAGKHGEVVVLASNTQISTSVVEKLQREVKQAGVQILDVLYLMENPDNENKSRNWYMSYMDEDIMTHDPYQEHRETEVNDAQEKKIAALSPAKQQAARERIIGYDSAMKSAENRLKAIKSQYEAKRKEIGQRFNDKFQTDMFGQEQKTATPMTLFGAEAEEDFGRRNMERILQPLKDQLKRAEEEYLNMKDGREDYIDQVVKDTKAQTELMFKVDPANADINMKVEAWHGSPYAFDRFSTKKVDTGEGVQAFGWGLYFTDLEGIAREYANRLSDGTGVEVSLHKFLKDKFGVRTDRFAEYMDGDIASNGYARLYIDTKGFSHDVYGDFYDNINRNDYLSQIRAEMENNSDVSSIKYSPETDLITVRYKPKNEGRNLYKVAIHGSKNVDELNWLDWDQKPTNEQRKIFKEALNNLFEQTTDLTQEDKARLMGYVDNPNLTAGKIYELLMPVNGAEQLSLALLDKNIDGIRYPAETKAKGATRDTARGFNYVVFDENAVSIEEHTKYKVQAFDNKAPKKMTLAEQVKEAHHQKILSTVQALEQHATADTTTVVARDNNELIHSMHLLGESQQVIDLVTRTIKKKTGKLVGFHSPLGNIYIVSQNMHEGNVVSTWIHEVGVHHGIRRLIPDDNKRMELMAKVYHDVGEQAFREMIGDDGTYSHYKNKSASAKGEEYLARLAEKMDADELLTKQEQSVWDKFVNWINNLLSDIYKTNVKLTDEVLRDIVRASVQSVIGYEGQTADTILSHPYASRAKRARKYIEALVGEDAWGESNPADAQLQVEFLIEQDGKQTRKAEPVADKLSDKIQRKLFDAQIGMKNILDMLEKDSGKKIPDFANPYWAENRARSTMRYAMDSFDNKQGKALLEAAKMLRLAGMSEKDVHHYMVAKHAPERNAKFRNEMLTDRRNKDNGALQMYMAVEAPSKEMLDKFKAKQEKEFIKYKNHVNTLDFSGISELDQNGAYENPDDLANEMVERYEKTISKRQKDEFWKAVKNATEFSLEQAYLSGELTQDEYDYYMNLYDHYVPLRGWEHGNKTDLFDYSPERPISDVYNATIKHAEGRVSMAGNPLPMIFSMAHSAIMARVKNEVKQHALNLARMFPDRKDLLYAKKTYLIENEDGTYSEVVDRPSELVKYRTRVNRDHRKRIEQRLADQNEIKVYENGEAYVLVFPDPVVAKGFNVKNELHPMFRPIAYYNRLLSAWLTSKNPNFILSNQKKDLEFGFKGHTVNMGLNFAKDFVKNYPASSSAIIRHMKRTSAETGQIEDFFDRVAGVSKKQDKLIDKVIGKEKTKKQERQEVVDQYYEEWLENGGPTGYVHLWDIKQYERKISRAVQRAMEPTAKHALRDIYQAEMKMTELMAKWSENTSRFSSYLTARQHGKSISEAIWISKDADVNFDKKGEWTHQFAAFYAFFGPTMGGIRKFGMWVSDPKTRKKFMMMAAFAFVQGFAHAYFLDLLGEEDEEGVRDYDKVSPFLRNFYRVYPTKALLGFNITMPIAHNWKGFHSAGSIAYDNWSGRIDWDTALLRAAAFFSDSYSPFSVQGLVDAKGKLSIRPFVPTPLVPAFDLDTNQDFAGRMIYREPYTPELDRITPHVIRHHADVNPAIKQMAYSWYKLNGGDIESASRYDYVNGKHRKIPFYADINPAWVEHLAGTVFGGRGLWYNQVYKTVNGMVNTTMNMIKDENTTLPEQVNENFTLRDTPIINRFFRNVTADVINREYRELVNEAASINATYKRAVAGRDRDKVLQMQKDPYVKDMLATHQLHSTVRSMIDRENKLRMEGREKAADAQREEYRKIQVSLVQSKTVRPKPKK